MKTVTKWCESCGKIMWNVKPNKRFCEKCMHDKNLNYARNGYQRQKAKKAEKKRKEQVAAANPFRQRSIEWCVREAEKRGMSYGRFVGLVLDKEAQA